MQSKSHHIQTNSDIQQEHFAFLLLENFSLMAFSAAIDTLRQANRKADRDIYSWTLLAQNGESATASNGTEVRVNSDLDALPREVTIIVCGGIAVKEASTKPILNWLRRESRKGLRVGGICTGAQTLAMAGLLDGRSCTIHWENRDSFEEEFPEIELKQSVFVIDGPRFTSSGGLAPADLMLKLIADKLGNEIATAVADGMIYTAIRTDKDSQRLSIPTRIGVRHPKLATVIQMMEDNLEEPVSPSLLAQDVHMSTRQLERLFRRYLNRSPKRYYMELRLNKARNLLMQTDMSVINVALACGFASPSHFSKCYRAHFDTTPYRERGATAAEQS